MRIKQRPEDFKVTEEVEVALTRDGKYGVYRLWKRKVPTLEAVERIARAAGLATGDLRVAGLKDRQAVTEQHITIAGPTVEYDDGHVRLEYLGRSDDPEPWGGGFGNRFELVVRDLTSQDVEVAERESAVVRRQGVVNYFDDQRFGALRHGQGFVARRIALGDVEGALRALVATPSPRDKTGDARLKQFLAYHWGHWEEVTLRKIPAAYKGSVGHLVRNPGDFAGAIVRVERRLLALHLFTWQSYLWNETVRRFLLDVLDPRQVVSIPYVAGTMVLPAGISDAQAAKLKAVEVPLLGPEGDIPDPAVRRAALATLAAEGVRREDLALRSAPGLFLTQEIRPLMVLPRGLFLSPPRPDRLNRGRRSVLLKFSLPSGAYGTVVCRRLFLHGFADQWIAG